MSTDALRFELLAPSVEDTRAIGAALGAELAAGDVVALCGDLGAGKTTMTHGIARALGFDGAVASPTFTLIREYDGRVPIRHVDVYRLERMQDVVDLGLEEMTDDGVLLVEWGDAIDDILGPDRLRVELTVLPGEARRVVVSAGGHRWPRRWQHLRAALERWAA